MIELRDNLEELINKTCQNSHQYMFKHAYAFLDEIALLIMDVNN
jgi:hypothetical protein